MLRSRGGPKGCMDDSRRLVREWQAAKEMLRDANLAFAAAVGERAAHGELMAMAREVARLQDHEHRLAMEVRSRRLRRGFFTPVTFPSTLPSVLG